MRGMIKGGAGREPLYTYTFTPIAFAEGTNSPRLASGSLPHACAKLRQKRPPAPGDFWLQARCHNLRRARENMQKMTCGGRSPRKHNQPQQS
ncbi:hypothetical protein O181_096434 [Austropuccinia psidii MF-1]|uniref:Uncharacterized protein n=1 Tax=Austropuccinia psidii MF-1 TaxID=1389203 RepID=A0A9Q3J7A3_9BASI|nr:hypothetical protein [Austropuccinia psidii MF-1]